MKRLWHGISLLEPLSIGVGFGLHALAGCHWRRLAAIATGVAACVLILSVISLTGYCVDCDKVPPRVGPHRGWVLRASGWEDCHPDAFMSWNDYNRGESE